MTARRLNANFLSAEELSAFGVENATERNILVHSTAVIVNFDSIRFGCNVRIDPYVVLSCSDLVLGDHVHIASGCGIFGRERVTLGDFSGFSSQGLIYSSNDDYSGNSLTGPTVPEEFIDLTHAEVVIGKHCIIGVRTTLLPGACLEEGAAVGAGSLVKGTLPEWTISGGVPAKPFKARSRECLIKEAELRAQQLASKST